MHIAMIGTRGVPARYGGFETAVEEIGTRLVRAGHTVTVYCRGEDRSPTYRGMQRVRLPSVRRSSIETLSHTAVSVAHLLRHRADVALVFNAANAPLLPLIRAARIPVAVHVDGLEWKRAKWSGNGARYYRAVEKVAVGLADALIADAAAIAAYYRRRHAADSVVLTYGAPIIESADAGRLAELGLRPGGFHLVVARMEPENHVDVVVAGYLASRANKPLVVVGSVPYPSSHERHVRDLAGSDPRVRLLGSLWDQELLNSLYAGAASYLHGHSVGGTNPSLLRAMGAGAPVVAWDIEFNREVLAETGRWFASPDSLAREVEAVEADPVAAARRGADARRRARTVYDWDDVAEGYAQLCADLHAGRRSRRGRRAGVAPAGVRR
ncbi:DUF1972 domain-containing protein [Pseudonocardia sp. ICBG1142]|uniref:DUF1972 domain-containing protein n=1 Tax=Pseudonocardia sp. ICBG1142 TaxID=2846760 RepID=UPI001CF61FD2|nr:DUF1972 domain-containing protein [Pseudonocardia sp. ICBG1142]